MPKTSSAVVDQPVTHDLISFLKAIPHGRYHRGVRYPQWFMLRRGGYRSIRQGFRELA
jgi:hypothetical protein